MRDIKKTLGDQIGKWFLILLGAAFVGSIIWSILFETLLPLVRAGNWLSLVYNLVGIPIILAGTAVIVYGGFLFLRDTFQAFSDEDTLASNLKVIEAKTSKEAVSQARRQNLWVLLRAWRRGTLWMAFGFLLIAVGGFLINYVP